jgi:hypothetical protein
MQLAADAPLGPLRCARRPGSTTGRGTSSSSTSKPPASAAAPARWRSSSDAGGSTTRGFGCGSSSWQSGGRARPARRARPDLREASLIVSYNGKSFDIPLMSSRWAFHRQSDPTGDLPHFDMLPPARRLWKQREDGDGCSLSSLERAVIGFHRHGDVPASRSRAVFPAFCDRATRR